jgi:hypothetical protein
MWLQQSSKMELLVVVVDALPSSVWSSSSYIIRTNIWVVMFCGQPSSISLFLQAIYHCIVLSLMLCWCMSCNMEDACFSTKAPSDG